MRTKRNEIKLKTKNNVCVCAARHGRDDGIQLCNNPS